MITEIGIKMHENAKEIHEVQFSMIFSNLSCSHISGNLRAWHSTPPTLRSVLCHWIFSLCSSCSLLPTCLVSLQDALPIFSSILQHSFNITEFFYPPCLWSLIDLPSWAKGLILLSLPLELGLDIQATKVLNGLWPNPGSSSVHALMLQPLPSRFSCLKSLFASHIIFGNATALYKACAMRIVLFHSADTWFYSQPLVQC